MTFWGQHHLSIKKRSLIALGAFMALAVSLCVSVWLNALPVRVASVCFVALLVLLLLGIRQKIVVVSEDAISSLADFLDSIRVEGVQGDTISSFQSKLPEVSALVDSIHRLLGRIGEYRARSIRRLLIEKRRADIISASITDGVFLFRGSEFLYANPIGEKILGVYPVKGMDLARHREKSGPNAVLAAISRSIPIEFTLESGDRKAYYLLQAYPVFNPLGAPDAGLDFDEESELDSLLDRFQPDMVVMAQDVTLVRESQEAKRHFLGTLSHEVKTPVTSLTMATRLLKRDLEKFENPTHKSLIKTCIDDVERLRGLLEDLLNVSRFDTLTQRMEVQTIDLGKLVRHSVQSFQPEAKERSIDLSCQVVNNGKPILVPVDASKISWALSNLLTNALRHTPPNGKIETEIRALEDGAEFRVRDTGPGIDRKRQTGIFDKFNPYYDLRVARTGSAGVGLAIAREIVVAHGGKIWVSSEPGHGAEFCFVLPLKRVSGASMGDETIINGISQRELKGAIRGTTASG